MSMKAGGTHIKFGVQVWKNCRTYNEGPHEILDMCDEAEALVDRCSHTFPSLLHTFLTAYLPPMV